jgi:hypothetical protein
MIKSISNHLARMLLSAGVWGNTAVLTAVHATSDLPGGPLSIS